MKFRTALIAVAFGLLAPFTAFADSAVAEVTARTTNPPPTSALNAFQRFEVKPVAMDAPYAGQKANEIAKERLQANLDLRLNPLVSEWNAKGTGEAPRTLVIQPAIQKIRFISGGKRLFAGAFAGSSWLLVSMKATDAATGEVVADAEFFQQANGFGAGWTFGATDKTMLIRVSNMVTEYLRANYAQAVGGAVDVAPEISN